MKNHKTRYLSFAIFLLPLIIFCQEIEILYPKQHSYGGVNLLVTNNGEKFLSYSDNSPIQWDLNYGVALKKFKGHEYGVSKIIEDKNNEFYSLGSQNIIKWNKEGDVLKKYKNSNNNPTNDFDVSNKYIVGASWLYTYVWDIESQKEIAKIKIGPSSHTLEVSFINNTSNYFLTLRTNYSGGSVLSSDSDSDNQYVDSLIFIWDGKSNEPTSILECGNGSIAKFIMDKKNSKLYTLSTYGEFKIFDLSQPRKPKEITPYNLTKHIKESSQSYIWKNTLEGIDKYILSSNSNYLLTEDQYLFYLLESSGELKTYDYSNPKSPEIIQPELLSEQILDLFYFRATPSDKVYDIQNFYIDSESGVIYLVTEDFNLIKYDLEEDHYQEKKLYFSQNINILDDLLFNTKLDSIFVYDKNNLEFLFSIFASKIHYVDSQKIIYSDKNDFINVLSRKRKSIIKRFPTQQNLIHVHYDESKNSIHLALSNRTDIIDLNYLQKKSIDSPNNINGHLKKIKFPQNNYILLSDSQGKSMKKLNHENGEYLKSDFEIFEETKIVGRSSDESYLYGYDDNMIKIFRSDNMSLIKELYQNEGMNHFEGKWMKRSADPQTYFERISSTVSFSGDMKYFVISVNDSLIHFKNSENNELIQAIEVPRNYTEEYSMIKFLKNSYDIIYADSWGNIYRINPFEGSIKYEYSAQSTMDDITEIYELDDYPYLVLICELAFELVDKNTGKLIYNHKFWASEDDSSTTNHKLTADKKNIISWADHDVIKILSLPSFEVTHDLRTGIENIYDCFLNKKNHRLIIITNELNIKIFDLKEQTELLSIANPSNEDLFASTPENYYFASKNAAQNFFFKFNSNIYPFEQFDLKFNRPDKVFSNLDENKTELINSYRKAYEKRLKRLGFNERMLSQNWHTPEVKITNLKKLQEYNSLTNKSTIKIMISASDKKMKLEQLNFWVNDVPIFGYEGINLKEKNTSFYQSVFEIKLTEGENKIQISTINEKGTESNRETFYITYEPEKPTKPNLFIVGIGVSKYSHINDLINVDNDVRDLVSLYEMSEGKFFNKVFVDTLLNEKVKKEELPRIKKWLSTSKVNDVVIVLYSGHGDFNSENDYYLFSYDIHHKKIADRGILYQDFEDILDGVPARKKLLIINACKSGEFDSDKIDFEMMNILFSDLRRGSGAMVISSSAVDQYSFTGSSKFGDNSAFGFALTEILNSKEQLNVKELNDLLSNKINSLTFGKQRPTLRSENLELDFRIW